MKTLKINIIWLILLIFLLSACNLPTQKTADPDVVAQMVESTLTAQASQIVIQEVTNTSESQPEASPSETFTATVQNTETLTPTPEQTATPTETFTPTISPDDPKQTLGQPAWRNTLDSGGSFGLDAAGYEDDYSRIKVANGVMELTSFSTYGYRNWRLTSQNPDDFYIEAIFKTQVCSGNDLYGLVMRAPDYSSGGGYYAGLTCNGQYNLSKITDSGTSYIISNTTVGSILSGAGQTNRLGILANGESLKIYINEKLITEISDSSYTDGGYIGAFVAGSSGSLTVYMDEISYWNLP
jgi:hypothetical protein